MYAHEQMLSGPQTKKKVKIGIFFFLLGVGNEKLHLANLLKDCNERNEIDTNKFT